MHDWPPPPDAKSDRLLEDVDTDAMPNAKHFSACLEALADVPDNHYVWNPYIGKLHGTLCEMHNKGIPNHDYSASTIPVKTMADYQNTGTEPEYVSTVFDHLDRTPAHFMSFAQVLSGQKIDMAGSGDPNASSPVDWAYFQLAFGEHKDAGSAGKGMKSAVEDFSTLNDAGLAVSNPANWEGGAQEAAAYKFEQLMNFLLHVRGPIYAELSATLAAYVALVKGARQQLDDLMAQADAALLAVDATDLSPISSLAQLLTLAGFIPGLSYGIAFGIQAASMVVSKIESEAEKKAGSPKKITIPADHSQSCVDVLRWFALEARATCEDLGRAIDDLVERLHDLIAADMKDVANAEMPVALKTWPA
jgi:hypothetical protein